MLVFKNCGMHIIKIMPMTHFGKHGLEIVKIFFFNFYCFCSFWRQQLAAGRSLNCASCRGLRERFAQVAIRQFTQWPWIEHPTFQLGGRHVYHWAVSRPKSSPHPGKNVHLCVVNTHYFHLRQAI